MPGVFEIPTLKKVALMALLVLVMTGAPPAGSALGATPLAKKPNILFILTDDLDAGSTAVMPNLRKQLVLRGTTFGRAYATAPQCCPSRASFLTGRYPHNHAVYDNHATLGGARKFRVSGGDKSTVAAWLDSRGYQTILIGKYLNWYEGRYVPPGWDEWRGQQGRNNNHRYNINGRVKYFSPRTYHDTDLFSDWATSYVRKGAGKKRPFFMYLSVNAPHGPATPAARHAKKFSRAAAPRPPSFNEADVSDKPARIRALPRLSTAQVRQINALYRDRLRSMLAVDDMIGRLVRELRKTGELDETYIVFTSDHGFHMGQHRMLPGKTLPYEEDIRVPLYVRGPGVPGGRKLEHKALNVDLAPTFAGLGGAPVPDEVDGRSLVPLLNGSPPPTDSWRKSFLIEFYRQGIPAEQGDGFHALRAGDYSYVEYANGERELYDLAADPYQLENVHDGADPTLISELQMRLEALKACAGATCRAAEDLTPP